MITICEVGVRDGLQNESTLLSTEQKVDMLSMLTDSGVTDLEAVSFVHPKHVPAMADAEEVLLSWDRPAGIEVAGLALNERGIQRALHSTITKLHVSMAVSNAFNQKNSNCSVEEGLANLLPNVQEAAEDISVTAILATSFGCPFSGKVNEMDVLSMTEKFLHAGASKIVLGDTTGMANPYQVKQLVRLFYSQFGENIPLGLHFHNTRGLALANVLAGYEAGVTHFDASLGGLGGCPYAPLAVGNVCTEDLVHMFHEIDVTTGINLDKLLTSARTVESWFPKSLPGMVMKAGKRSELARS
ncbi:hydroxymethylglutaryl-CoA lyase [Shouchella patagoniensis]|uniref:hydroxymethylglutaryl-CoA lyase n=1 Tax=Shouchella patagoniensis TaxID=228576 RepID=UPI000994AC2A|nr:hydroxymethylglutaryl-CoA lyase [Shouchella patagoniensis]